MEKNSIPMEGGENDLKQMIKKINWLGVLPTLLVAAFMLVSVVLPHTSFASTTIPDPGLCSRVNGLNCNQYTLNGLIIRVINWILAITLAVDVLFMVIGGFLYITSAGNEERAKKGRTTVINAIIGLVIIILAYVIANVVSSFFSTENFTA
jgi:hypothetical protein